MQDFVLLLTDDYGKSKAIDFGVLPCGADFQQELAERFYALGRGSGTWNSLATFTSGMSALRQLLRQRHIARASSLTPADIKQWHLARTESRTRSGPGALGTVLAGMPEVTDDVRRVLRSLPAGSRDGQPKVKRSLSRQQVEHMRRSAMRDLESARDRIRAGWATVAAYRAGEIPTDHPDHDYAKVLDEIARTGDIADRYPSKPAQRRVPRSVMNRVYGVGDHRTSTHPLFADLFMTGDEAGAALVALIATCGWNLSVATGVRLTDFNRVDSRDGSEPVHLRVTLRKQRRGIEDTWSESYVDAGPRSKVYVLGLVYDCTKGAREVLASLGAETDALLVVLANGLNAGRFANVSSPLFPMNLLDRRTVMVYLSRWRARDPALAFATPTWLRQHFVTVRHPQGHSLDMHADYVLRDSSVRELAQPVIADGIQAAVDCLVATVVDSETATAIHAPVAERRAQLELLNSGGLDAVVSACQDPEDSPITGGRCSASLLMCLDCQNAVVLRRHLPRNWLLWERLDALRGASEPEVWARRWSDHFARLTDLLTPGRYFEAAVLQAARKQRRDEDIRMVDRLLGREFDV